MVSVLAQYVLTQIPAGWLAQRFGPKPLLLLNLLGTAACFGLLPAAFATRLGSSSSGGGGGVGSRSVVLLPAALLTTMGLFQGALIPGEAAIHSTWLPDSAWRPFVLQAMFLWCGLETCGFCASHPVVY
jgi:MFS family permease